MPELCVGIDLGTTFSVVASLDDDGAARIIENAEGEQITPSAVLFDGEQIVVGSYAMDNAEAYPGQVAQLFKRQMGEPHYSFSYGGKDYSPAELSGFILGKLKRDVEERLGRSLTDAVITVPAYFGDPQRRATLQAAELAGLNASQLLNEPTAAAYAYGLHRLGQSQRVLVFDLGGGTFDVTVMEIKGDAIEVQATGGDHHLGGADWDEALLQNLAEKFRREHGVNLLADDQAVDALHQEALRAKLALSSLAKVSVSLRGQGRSMRLDVRREEFEQETSTLVDRCRMLTEMVLREANRKPQDIDQVLLVGGATRMPMIPRLVGSMFDLEIGSELNPDESVAVGAAIKAALLNEKKRTQIARKTPRGGSLARMRDTNVTSHSFGLVVLSEGLLHNSIIIPKNTAYPCEKSRSDYTNTYSGQETLKVVLTEGEDNDPYNCDLIGHYEAYDLPAVDVGQLRLQFTYRYNDNQVVEVEAHDIKKKRRLPVRRLPGTPNLAVLLGRPIDVALVLDCSGSMDGQALVDAKRAAIQFVTDFDHPLGRVALVTFPGGIRYQLGTDVDLFTETVQRLDANNGTPMTYGLMDAAQLVSDEGHDRVILLLTDGTPDDPVSAALAALQAKQIGVRIIAVGVGEADETFLRGIVSEEDDYHRVGETVQLSGAFAAIASQLSTHG